MFIPELKLSPIYPEANARIICNFLCPDKTNNKTLPFAEKTLSMYPELRDIIDLSDEKQRNQIITAAVYKRLQDASDEINSRINYFSEKFNTFFYDFIVAQCNLYNYQWTDEYPVINCYVGYIPFYPRSTACKTFNVSYNDDERVFSGAVHEINHMIFYEKCKEMYGNPNLKEKYFPDPLWFLEEIIVDPTLNDLSVKPFTLYENRAYDQFYTQMVNGKSIMQHILDMYDSKNSIEEFIIDAYNFVCQNIEFLIKGE
ncbi:hypothetical protein [Anaerosporobacter sp.]